MTKETRANLLFLAVFLAISLPGGVILFKKKLDPAVPPSYMPETMRRSLPYNAPADSPDLQRYVPEGVGKWVGGLAREHGYENVLYRDNLPVMSGNRRWQLIGVRESGKGMVVDLLLWEGIAASDSTLELRGGQGDGAVEGSVESRQVVGIPEAVRKELVYGGYPKPPKEVTWVSASFEGLTERRPDTLVRMRWKSSVGDEADSVTVFTN